MRKLAILLTFALFGSAAMSIWLWRELGVERARNAKLSARLDSPSAPAKPLPAPVTPQEETPAPAPAPLPATSESQRHVQGTQEEWETYRRRLMQDPKYREAWRQQQRLKLAPRQENLIRLLGLTPEQSDAVIELSIDRELDAKQLTPPDPITEEFRQQQKELHEREEQAHQAKLRELLGEEKRARLEDYMESRPSRMQVYEFRDLLSGADVLRDDQVEPLITALHVERTKMQEDLRAFRDTLSWEGYAPETWRKYSERQLELLKAAHDRMHSAAAPILSSAQLERLDTQLKRDLERHEAQERMNRAQAKLN